MSQCRACVVSCMDFRIQSAVARWLESKGLKDDYDYIAVPGATKDFAGRGLLDMVEASIRLHQCREVILVHHEDCGAYGLGALPVAAQLAKQKEDMEKAAATLREKHPGVTVRLAFAYLDGRVEELDSSGSSR